VTKIIGFHAILQVALVLGYWILLYWKLTLLFLWYWFFIQYQKCIGFWYYFGLYWILVLLWSGGPIGHIV
jgi:hypothetical protein